MLSVRSFVYNAFQENTYIIINDKKECWVVDPGMYDAKETKEFKEYLIKEGLKLKGIINTHGHIDHIFGVQELIDSYKVPFGIHQKETLVLYGAKGAAMLFGFEMRNVPEPSFMIEENVPLKIGDDALQVLFVPGHSPGSVAFYSPSDHWVISGDALFADSIGRTDLPGGDHATLIRSIKTELLTLPEETIVYSGHGPTTTIGREKVGNQYLR